MKKIVLALTLFVLAAPLYAQRDSTADAEYLIRRYEYTLNKDGSMTTAYSHQVKLYTGYSYNRVYGESFIVYNPEWQTLKVDRSVTTMANGDKVESPYNAFNEVLPRVAHNISPYNKLREMVVTHTALEPGSVIDFAYTVKTKAGFFPGLADRVLLADRSPMQKLEVIVRVPKGTAFTYALLNAPESAPAKTADAGMDVYTWQFTDIPLVAVESHQPPMWEFCPSLLFSTMKEEDILRHTIPGQAHYTLNQNAKDAAAKAVDGKNGQIEKARAIQKLVIEQIAPMHGGLEYTGYKAMPAQKTWDEACGSAMDVAVLFAALCKSAGVDAVPVLLAGNVFGREADALSPALFFPVYTSAAILLPSEHALLEIDHERNNALPEELAGRRYLPLRKGAVSEVYPMPDVSRVSTLSDWTIQDDTKVFGSTTVEASGVYTYTFKPDEMGNSAKKVLAATGWGCETSVVSSRSNGADESRCEIKLAPKTAAPESKGFMHFNLVTISPLSNRHLKTTSAPRSTPVKFFSSISEEHAITLHYPDMMKPVALPEKVELQNAVGSVRSVYIDRGQGLEIIRSIEIPGTIAPAQYDDLKALIDVWNDPARNEVVFEMK